MPKPKRTAPGGLVYHVLNRGVGRRTIFDSDDDYRAFLRVVTHSLRLSPMRICCYCLMSNHWHFVLWPEQDGQLSAFMQRLTNTHVQRWQRHKHEVGHGHLYQGRFKSFPVQDDEHFYQVARYVERNALRAGLTERAEAWKWCSLSSWRSPDPEETFPLHWPLPKPVQWLEHVNAPQTEGEVEAIRRAIRRGRPLGQATWVREMADRLELQVTLRERGRPRKAEAR